MMRGHAICMSLVCGLALSQAGAASAQTVTFADVLKRPDDVSITLAYFDQLVAQGRLDAGAAALERALLVNPDADPIRVAYMLVLYRLGDLSGAQREIEILEKRPLPPELAAQVARQKREVEASAKTVRFSAAFSAGARYDSNRSLASSADTGLLLGSVIPNTKSEEPDVAGIGAFSFLVERDLDPARRWKLFASLDVSAVEQRELSIYSLHSGAMQAGVEWRNAPIRVRVAGIGRGLRLGNENFGYEAGGSALASVDLGERFTAFADVEAVHQAFRPVEASTSADLRTGARFRAGGGASFQVTDRLQLGAGAHGTVKLAEVDQYAYQSVDIDASGTYLMSGGQYARVEATASRTRFEKPDPVYSSTVTREDDAVRARVAYGVPLRTLGAWSSLSLPDAIGSVTIQAAADVSAQWSNIPDFTYTDYGGEALLIRRVNF